MLWWTPHSSPSYFPPDFTKAPGEGKFQGMGSCAFPDAIPTLPLGFGCWVNLTAHIRTQDVCPGVSPLKAYPQTEATTGPVQLHHNQKASLMPYILPQTTLPKRRRSSSSRSFWRRGTLRDIVLVWEALQQDSLEKSLGDFLCHVLSVGWDSRSGCR